MHFSTYIKSLTLLSSLAFAIPAPQEAVAEPAPSATSIDSPAITSVHAVPAVATIVAPDVNVGDVKASSLGRARVLNQCNFPVYLYVCGQNPAECGLDYTLDAKTGSWSEEYSSTANNGRSIKIGLTPGKVAKPIMQLEYTNGGNGQVWYDVSEVDGNPFGPYGYTLFSSNDKCFQSHCSAPCSHDQCPWVFTDPTNGVPETCPIGDDVGVTLCG